jgi:hypothetical protein
MIQLDAPGSGSVPLRPQRIEKTCVLSLRVTPVQLTSASHAASAAARPDCAEHLSAQQSGIWVFSFAAE